MRSPLADMVRMCTTSKRDSLGTWCSAPLSSALLHSAEFSSVNTCDGGRGKGGRGIKNGISEGQNRDS